MKKLFLVLGLLVSISASAALSGNAAGELSSVNSEVNSIQTQRTQAANDIAWATGKNLPEYSARLAEWKSILDAQLVKWQALQLGLIDADNGQP